MRFFLLTLITFSLGFAEEEKPLLRDFARNDYSQWGEDGIIEKIFEVIGESSRTCVEFGACEGLHLSNTAHLWKDQGWSSILIESNSDWYSDLSQNTDGYDCTCIHAKVGFSPTDSLEYLLRNIHFDKQVDLLSIDIDGDDYYVLESLEFLRPRVIICEYNPTIPAHMDVYAEPGNYMGCSVAALNRIASIKGYTLVSITETNCFYVLDEEVGLFGEFALDLNAMKIDSFLRYFITDYSGNYKVIGTPDSRNAYGFRGESKYRMDGESKVYSSSCKD